MPTSIVHNISRNGQFDIVIGRSKSAERNATCGNSGSEPRSQKVTVMSSCLDETGLLNYLNGWSVWGPLSGYGKSGRKSKFGPGFSANTAQCGHWYLSYFIRDGERKNGSMGLHVKGLVRIISVNLRHTRLQPRAIFWLKQLGPAFNRKINCISCQRNQPPRVYWTFSQREW